MRYVQVMPFTTLIDTDSLAARLDDPGIVLVDCRFQLADAAWGEQAYLEQHLPGAVYAHLDRDLSGPKTGANGRHPLPLPEALTATLGRLGISTGQQVVAYDQDNGMFASRVWWLLRWMGHESVAVLDGGLGRWIAEGGPTMSGRVEREPRVFTGAPRPDMIASLADVTASLGNPNIRLIDARAPGRYRGDVEPIDRVGGHIPGAANRFFQDNLAGGLFRAPDALRADFEQAAAGLTPDRVISYCGSGVTGCHNLLAMAHAGLHGARLYPGSWSEWSADPARPVEKG